jgi:hypothetical protein
MPPRRRRPARKSSAPTTRVKKIAGLEAWAAMRVRSDRGLVLVQFYQNSMWTCKQLRPHFLRLSTTAGLRRATFAEVDGDQAEVRRWAATVAGRGLAAAAAQFISNLISATSCVGRS